MVFLTPLAALVGVAALLPLGALLLREHRARRLRHALGLGAPSLRRRLAAAAALAALLGLLAVAAAQPAVRERAASPVRRDAEAFVVFDTSRSMLAARGPGSPTRFARAIAFAERLRGALPQVPFGVATLTDRVLPNLFPSPDAEDFAHVAERTLAIESPPPEQARARSTDYGALVELSTQNYFRPSSRHRLVVVLTDGESSPFDERWAAHWLRRSRIGLVVVRFWDARERIAGDARYRPDPAAGASADRLSRAVSGKPSFAEARGGAVAATARRLLGKGPAGEGAAAERVRPLASYAVGAAAAPLAFLLLAGRVRPRRR